MSSVPLNVRQAAAREILLRDDALSSLWDFIPFMRPSAQLDFAYEPAAHHDKIIEALHGLERGDYSKLMILAPPGSAKSTYCSISFPLWYLARHPDHNVLACSNTEHLAESFNRRRRSGVMSAEWQRLSGTSLDPSAQGIGRWFLQSGGSCTASGVGSSIVGLRSNLNVLDDPITSFEQSMSETQLTKIWDWYLTDLRSRLLPTGKELIVTTRWSRRDPAGRILDLIREGHETGWHVLRLPMLADSPDDPLGRAEGAPLWPSWFGDHQITDNQRDPRRWSALYQQRPMDDSGAWVPSDKLISEPSAPDQLTYVIAVDLALSVGKGDYTVFVVAGLDSARNLHVVDVRRARIPPNESVELAFQLTHRYQPTAVLIDDDNASKVWARLAHELARERNSTIPLWPLPTRGQNKETRGAAIRGFLLAERVRFVQSTWLTDVFRELLEFPAGDHDDIVDCLSLLGRHFASSSAPSPPKDQNFDPYAGLLIRPDMPGVMQVSLDDMWEKKRGPRARV